MSNDAQATIACDVKDLALADSGKRRIEWAFQAMPVLQSIRKNFIKGQPLAGVNIAACLHVTAEAANLMVTLRDGGASVALCSTNAHSTQDDVASSLVRDYHIPVFAIKGDSVENCHLHMVAALETNPMITMDDSGDLLALLHTKRQDLLSGVRGGTVETASATQRAAAMFREGVLQYPVIAVNGAETKHLFDSRYGAGQSTLDGIIRATNILLAGLNFVVAGYGCCGRGLAQRARGMGANVIVTEIDPMRALEALMDGFRVMSMSEAAPIGDIFCTVTGNKCVIGKEHFEKLKNGAILCNSGHFNVEIDVEALTKMASSHRPIREFVEEYALRDGRRVHVLAEGRLINMAAAEGHPASVMDMSFANQALSVEYIAKNHSSLEKKCYPVPPELDKQVARMKLDSMGVKIDRLTMEQERYLASWSEGI